MDKRKFQRILDAAIDEYVTDEQTAFRAEKILQDRAQDMREQRQPLTDGEDYR